MGTEVILSRILKLHTPEKSGQLNALEQRALAFPLEAGCAPELI
jgi:hypothetical protein